MLPDCVAALRDADQTAVAVSLDHRVELILEE